MATVGRARSAQLITQRCLSVLGTLAEALIGDWRHSVIVEPRWAGSLWDGHWPIVVQCEAKPFWLFFRPLPPNDVLVWKYLLSYASSGVEPKRRNGWLTNYSIEQISAVFLSHIYLAVNRCLQSWADKIPDPQQMVCPSVSHGKLGMWMQLRYLLAVLNKARTMGSVSLRGSSLCHVSLTVSFFQNLTIPCLRRVPKFSP